MGAQARELWDVSGAAARAHGAARMGTALRAQRLRRGAGFELGEARELGLLDPRMRRDQAEGWISKERALAMQRRLNPEELEALTEDKVIFYRYCEAVGLPVPRLEAVVPRDSPGWSRRGRMLNDAHDWEALVRADLPPEFVIKPSRGYHGLGVRVLRRTADGLATASGTPVTASDVFRDMRADPEFATHVVQERLHNHPELADLTHGAALQTLRIGTYVDRVGTVRILFGRLKIAVGDDAVDNFRAGATGNAMVEISVHDGMLGPALVAAGHGCGLVTSPLHPATGERIEGRLVPGWDDACALVRRASPHFLPIRTLGWDVAVTPGGPSIVEANMWWDPWSSRGRAWFAEMLADCGG